jgi:hypothetical protein
MGELCSTRRRLRSVVWMSLTRAVSLKSIAVGLTCGALLAVASPASAAAPRRCAPSEPSFTSLTATPTVSCRQARALNTFMTTHETLAGRFVLNGVTWLGTVSSRADNQTDMVYRHGTQTVWITYGGLAS